MAGATHASNGKQPGSGKFERLPHPDPTRVQCTPIMPNFATPCTVRPAWGTTSTKISISSLLSDETIQADQVPLPQPKLQRRKISISSILNEYQSSTQGASTPSFPTLSPTRGIIDAQSQILPVPPGMMPMSVLTGKAYKIRTAEEAKRWIEKSFTWGDVYWGPDGVDHAFKDLQILLKSVRKDFDWYSRWRNLEFRSILATFAKRTSGHPFWLVESVQQDVQSIAALFLEDLRFEIDQKPQSQSPAAEYYLNARGQFDTSVLKKRLGTKGLLYEEMMDPLDWAQAIRQGNMLLSVSNINHGYEQIKEAPKQGMKHPSNPNPEHADEIFKKRYEFEKADIASMREVIQSLDDQITAENAKLKAANDAKARTCKSIPTATASIVQSVVIPWAVKYEPGRLGQLGLEIGKFSEEVTVHVPSSKVPRPGPGGKTPPSWAWLLYTVLARIEGGKATLSALYGMCREWCPKLNGNNASCRHALTQATAKAGGKVFANADNYWSIADIDYVKNAKPGGRYKKGSKKQTPQLDEQEQDSPSVQEKTQKSPARSSSGSSRQSKKQHPKSPHPHSSSSSEGVQEHRAKVGPSSILTPSPTRTLLPSERISTTPESPQGWNAVNVPTASSEDNAGLALKGIKRSQHERYYPEEQDIKRPRLE